jgi:translocation and assembly module TamA
VFLSRQIPICALFLVMVWDVTCARPAFADDLAPAAAPREAEERQAQASEPEPLEPEPRETEPLEPAPVEPAGDTGEPVPTGFRYVARVRNAPSPEIKKLMQEVSNLRAKQDKPVSGSAVLVRRSRSDIAKLEQVLDSEGYYDGSVELSIDEEESPVEVLLVVDAGRRFVFADIRTEMTDGSPLPADESLVRQLSRIERGKPARSADIVDAERLLLAGFAEIGRPFARIADRAIEVDHATDEVDVFLQFESGPEVTFGEVVYEGLESIPQTYVRNRLPWKSGDRYRAKDIADARRALQATGLFATVRLRHAPTWNEDHSVPIHVYLEEADFRTLGIGVEYNSDTGAGANTFWEHRNFRGKAERLRIGGEVTEIGWGANLEWRKRDFWRKDFVLEYDLGYETEDTDGYETEIVATSIGLDVPVAQHSHLKGGVLFEYGPVTSGARDASGERRQDETFTLVGLPLRFRRVTVENILEPREGTRFELTTTPYLEPLGSDLTFVSNRGTFSFYLPLPRLERSILANRISAGAILGAERNEVPVNKLFFAGGGGSIRGYEYQSVGPLDADDDPIGGRSLFETGTELRIRILDWFGIVGFFEGGSVFSTKVPDFDETLRWGAGGGLRFYTGIGPFRVDVGTPVNPRSSDDSVQFYISLGEAY